MSKRIRIGLIGCGMIARSHINGYLAHPQHAEIVAVCDTVEANVKRRAADFLSVMQAARAGTAKTAAEKAEIAEARERLKADAALLSEYADNGVKSFNDYNEMIQECDLDAVSLALPPFVHEVATVTAAKAGLHVFCEKPMARTATEARNMRDACDAAGVKLAYQSGGTCLDPTSYAIRESVTSGKIGDVYYGRLTSFRVRGRPNIDMFGFGRWFLNSAFSGGGDDIRHRRSMTSTVPSICSVRHSLPPLVVSPIEGCFLNIQVKRLTMSRNTPLSSSGLRTACPLLMNTVGQAIWQNTRKAFLFSALKVRSVTINFFLRKGNGIPTIRAIADVTKGISLKYRWSCQIDLSPISSVTFLMRVTARPNLLAMETLV